MTYLRYNEDLPGLADVFLRDSSLYAPLLQFIEAVMTRNSALTKSEREMIVAHVSRINGCGFCLGAHRWTLAAMDVDWDTIAALEAGWTEQAVEDAINVIALFNYVNRVVDALGIEAEDTYFRRIGESIARRG